MRIATLRVIVVILALVVAASVSAQDLAQFEKRITVETLDNGLTVIVMERPVAPVFSFFTHVNVGGAQEVPGITGLAHMFEHMAFKGTDKIGTTDWEAENKAIAKVEETYFAYDRARRNPTGADSDEVARLEAAWKEAMAEADSYVKSNEFGEIIDRVGGVGLNAFTSNDETGYFFSMPSNRFELWAYLESERFLQPVMREFYKERNVVTEERRMRTESNPIGRLIEQFLTTAFMAHPYGQPVVGWPSDLRTFSATDAQAFHRKYYVPSNMVVTVVGDVKTPQALDVIRRYFGRIEKGEQPEPLRTEEPMQIAERTVVLRDPSQPLYIEGYHKPAITHPDNGVYSAIADLMSNGRTSRLYRRLVRDDQIAAASAGFNDFPGSKYPNLFAFFGIPTPGHTPDEIRDAIREEIERLKTEPVSAEELRMVKTRAKANLLRGLRSNQGLANQLGTYQAYFGDWRELFREVERIDKVTADDIQRVASATFIESNRTVGVIETEQKAAAQGGAE